MELPFDIGAARRNLVDATRNRRERLHGLYVQACRECSGIVEVIVRGYEPRRIWQWGSLLDERDFSEASDIDLAIEGVTDAPAFFSLYGDAMRCASFPLDIVQMERIEPEFADSIRSKGRIIYERA